jgi:hypothetical protein
VFHDGAWIKAATLVEMAKSAGYYQIAEHYFVSLFMYAATHPKYDVISIVNEVRAHYHLDPFPTVGPSVEAKSTIDDQARQVYRKMDDTERKKLLSESLHLLLLSNTNLFQKKKDWIGIYMVIRDRLDGRLSQTDFYGFANDITPAGWPEGMRIHPTTFNNYGRYVKYEDRERVYYEMESNQWKELCNAFWDIVITKFQMEPRWR